jgi:hypothetical protein
MIGVTSTPDPTMKRYDTSRAETLSFDLYGDKLRDCDYCGDKRGTHHLILHILHFLDWIMDPAAVIISAAL